MASLITTNLLLKVGLLMREMPMGQGWTTATQFRDFSGVSHATTYRYLKAMEKQGLVESKPFNRGKLGCYEYRITNEGVALLKSQGSFWVVS